MLPATGAVPAPLLAGGIALLVLGGAALVVVRRRHNVAG